MTRRTRRAFLEEALLAAAAAAAVPMLPSVAAGQDQRFAPSDQVNIAVIGGDGIGAEVTCESLKVLRAVAQRVGLDYQCTELPYSGEHYRQTGTVITDQQIDDLRQFDAILFGAIGHPDVEPGILERGLLLKLRFDLDLYINLRPVRLYSGVHTPLRDAGPEDINCVVVRENTEGLYCGLGGVMRKGTPDEISTQEMVATRMGVERCVRYAFELCRRRQQQGQGQGRLTLVHKTNVLTFCGDTWFRVFEEIGASEYREIERLYDHVDACCMYMTTQPKRYDTIVVSNMFGDIITDLGAAIAGGMGLAASGNLNPDVSRPGPSLFEPVHGSAPDIAGQNKANPIASLLSLAMLLQETGGLRQDSNAVEAGQRVEAAIATLCPQLAGQNMDRLDIGTDEVGDRVVDLL